MVYLITSFLFILGLAVGSFINVVSIRYDPDKGLCDLRKCRGRSRCLQCLQQLRWYELIPFVSFIIQRGRCRTCEASISFQYPFVEIAAALVTAGLPIVFSGAELAVWVAASYMLILLSAIDWRLKIIPDEANIFLGALGILLIPIKELMYGGSGIGGSFTGHYALLFGLRDSFLVNHFVAAAIAVGLFGLIVFFTRGEGMGMGDLKLAGAAGLLLGWPDTLFALMIAFIIGSLWGLTLIAARNKTLKSAIPFGPFIVLGIFIVVFWGKKILDCYFRIIEWIV